MKITYIISDIDKALAFEWVSQYLNKNRFQLSFILLNPGNSQLEFFLQKHGIEVHRITCRGKNDWLRATWQTQKLLKKIKPNVVHCHLFQANIIGLTAARLVGIKKRIYTRHHSSLHHIYHKKGVYWDKLCNYLATDIVAITKKVEEILIDWEKADPKKLRIIPHGFDLSLFQKQDGEALTNLRLKYNPEGKYPVIGVIARFTEWKGIQYIIPAFKKLLIEYPDALLLLFNANGDYKKEIEKLLANLPPDSFQTIAFEQNIFQTYHLFDVYVHTPIDNHSEAFGQTYVEALAASVPSVFTLSGIANEFIEHKKNAMVVNYKNTEEIYLSIKKILENADLKNELIYNGKASVQRFALDEFIKSLENLYAGTEN